MRYQQQWIWHQICYVALEMCVNVDVQMDNGVQTEVIAGVREKSPREASISVWTLSFCSSNFGESGWTLNHPQRPQCHTALKIQDAILSAPPVQSSVALR